MTRNKAILSLILLGSVFTLLTLLMFERAAREDAAERAREAAMLLNSVAIGAIALPKRKEPQVKLVHDGPYDVYIGRGFLLFKQMSFSEYKKWLWQAWQNEPRVQKFIASISNKTLGCYCTKGEACLGNALVALINYIPVHRQKQLEQAEAKMNARQLALFDAYADILEENFCFKCKKRFEPTLTIKNANGEDVVVKQAHCAGCYTLKAKAVQPPVVKAKNPASRCKRPGCTAHDHSAPAAFEGKGVIDCPTPGCDPFPRYVPVFKQVWSTLPPTEDHPYGRRTSKWVQFELIENSFYDEASGELLPQCPRCNRIVEPELRADRFEGEDLEMVERRAKTSPYDNATEGFDEGFDARVYAEEGYDEEGEQYSTKRRRSGHMPIDASDLTTGFLISRTSVRAEPVNKPPRWLKQADGSFILNPLAIEQDALLR